MRERDEGPLLVGTYKLADLGGHAMSESCPTEPSPKSYGNGGTTTSNRATSGAFNAFTEALKGNLIELPRRTEALHCLLDNHVGLTAPLLN